MLDSTALTVAKDGAGRLIARGRKEREHGEERRDGDTDPGEAIRLAGLAEPRGEAGRSATDIQAVQGT